MVAHAGAQSGPVNLTLEGATALAEFTRAAGQARIRSWPFLAVPGRSWPFLAVPGRGVAVAKSVTLLLLCRY